MAWGGGACCRRRGSGVGAACNSAAASRIPSAGSTHGNTGPSDRFDASQVGGQQFGQPVAGIFQQTRVIGRGDPLPGRGEFV